MTEKKVHVSFRMPEKLRADLEQMARNHRMATGEDKKLSEQLVEAVETYIKHGGKDAQKTP